MAVVIRRPQKSLEEMLLELNLLTQEQLRNALEALREGQSLEEGLVEHGLVPEETLALLTSMRLRIPFVNLRKQGPDQKALDLIPEWACRKYGVVPMAISDGIITVAMADPANIQTVDELATLTRKPIEPVVALRRDIEEAINVNYRISGEIEAQLLQIPGQQALGEGEQNEAALGREAIGQAPVVRAIDLLIRQASRDRASDIHIEPEEDSVRIRYRIDGILHEVMSLPVTVHSALISRIKIMAGMNIAERRRPQDGQISFMDGDKELDIRVATINTVHGEMAVLRLLNKSFALLSLPELGFLPESLEQYRLMLKMPFGMILISGPTGAGKTTTLYASVNQLDNVGRNVLTIEDPVEYRFKNINQIQVNPTAGLTFAAGLRATMRLDPDVILVGEIRDSETARIAIQAALTGHLVLSSIHANDTPGVIYRLIDLGVEPFLVASAVIGVVAQRMVRRVCPNCSRMASVSGEEQLAFERELGERRSQFVYGAGCNFCARTGYLGRTGIYEVMVLSEELRRLILNNAGSDAIRAQAVKENLITLWHDGMLKVRMGTTTPYEVIRNVFTIQ